MFLQKRLKSSGKMELYFLFEAGNSVNSALWIDIVH